MATIFSRTAEKLMQAALEDPLKEFKEIELIQAAGVGKGSGAEHITAFSKAGIFQEHRVGRTKILSLRLEAPTVFFLKNLRDQKRLQRLSKARLATVMLFRDQVQQSILLLVIFGSTIAGTAVSDSDIDLLVVSENIPLLESARKKAEEWFGQRLNLHVYNKKEIISQIKQDVFIQNTLLQGIVLEGYSLAAKMMSSLAGKEKQDFQRIEYFKERLSAIQRNYVQNDHGAAEEIADKLQEQLVFYILSQKGIAFKSKQDAAQAIRRIPEGKVFNVLAKSPLQRKIGLLDFVIRDLSVKEILGAESYGP